MSNSSVTRTATDALLAKWSALDAGYRPVVVGGEDVYGYLLQRLTAKALQDKQQPKRRQSPLVNAGYAARVAAMTYAVESFISFHETTPKLQVVMLGCGLDVLGIWSLLRASQQQRIHLLELDTHDIVNEKCGLLLSLNWLDVTSRDRTSERAFVEATLSANLAEEVARTGSAHDNLQQGTYTLAACDLRDIASVQAALAKFDRNNTPTLVLSELVLAYLGRQGVDQLLHWCACHFASKGSAFVAYEPLGPSLVKRSCTVIDRYKRDYCQHFRDKLQRGRMAHAQQQEDDDIFLPLGDCPGAVQKRAMAAGFPWVVANVAGSVVAFILDSRRSGFQPRKEPFDEHAALALHLHSYVYLTAFPAETDMDLIRTMCPWSTVSTYNMKAKVVQLIDDGSEITIGPMEPPDQPQVQELFTETYGDLAKEYPAVRKMVKTALKTDLAYSDEYGDVNYIGMRYQIQGGVFLVAVQAQENAPSRRRVVGCLGIGLCGERSQQHTTTFEIHRFTVGESARGSGVGKALLAAVEDDFVRNELHQDEPYRLVATTPALLKAANHFYKSNDFDLHKQEILSEMTINTYVKACVRPRSQNT